MVLTQQVVARKKLSDTFKVSDSDAILDLTREIEISRSSITGEKMFTGLIEEIGTIRQVVRRAESSRLTVQCRAVLEDANIGDSIAVNGICVTVVEMAGDAFTADIMPETMRKTNLDKLHVGNAVNLERALRLCDRLGGHLVSGHIDGAGTIIGREDEENAIRLTVEADAELAKYIVVKGSIALDGVSLTVASVAGNRFTISLIPHSAHVTILGRKGIGDTVNIECDLLGKYVEKLLGSTESATPRKQDISMDFLKHYGFA